MKTNITYDILIAVSKEAHKRGYKTTLTYNHDKWSLYMRKEKGSNIRIDHTAKISDIMDWIRDTGQII